MRLVVAFAAGVAIGVFFYGGLWWTVRALVNSRRAVLLTVASFWLRTVFAVGGVLLAARGSLVNALACLAGFTFARAIVTGFVERRLRRCT